MSITSKIYLNDIPLSRIDERKALGPIRAPDQIGAIWGQLAQAKTPKKARISLLGRLGVKRTDIQAQQVLLPMIDKALGKGVRSVPSEEDSGVFFLEKKGSRSKKWNKFAVFKVGEKRAQMELLARSMAHRIHLEKHAIPGVFCTIANPVFPKADPDDEEQNEIVAELWNGNVKAYRIPDSEISYNDAVRDDNFGLGKPFTLTGILEPYIEKPSNEISPEDFASMTLYALFIGLRDGKSNGISGSMIFDTEDCMPMRFIPESDPNTQVAATHLPFLGNPLAQQLISMDALKKLAQKIVEPTFAFFQFLGELAKERVEFADPMAESMAVNNTHWDHGGCPIQIEEQKKIMDQHSVVDITKTDRLLSDSQLFACTQRVILLRDFLCDRIQKDLPASTMDMVCAVDPLYGAHVKALSREKKDRFSSSSVVGRISPISTSPLSEEEINKIKEARAKTPSPTSLQRAISFGFSPISASSSENKSD